MKNDLISRQEAIRTITSYNGVVDKSVAKRLLLQMPSASTELSNNSPKLDNENGDLISRQAAIYVEGLDEEIRCEMCRNPMRTNRGCDGNCKYDERLYERIMQILSERIKPSLSAELRKRGKWVKHSYGLILKSRWGECSVCGNILDFAGVNAGRGDANYCPNCGADMREGEESE